MRQWPKNIEQILNNPIILIYFDDLCNCLYISTSELMFAISLSLRQSV